jgi:hypothetical protein
VRQTMREYTPKAEEKGGKRKKRKKNKIFKKCR